MFRPTSANMSYSLLKLRIEILESHIKACQTGEAILEGYIDALQIQKSSLEGRVDALQNQNVLLKAQNATLEWRINKLGVQTTFENVCFFNGTLFEDYYLIYSYLFSLTSWHLE
jgi:chaperonin cofactor prefoldin